MGNAASKAPRALAAGKKVTNASVTAAPRALRASQVTPEQIDAVRRERPTEEYATRLTKVLESVHERPAAGVAVPSERTKPRPLPKKMPPSAPAEDVPGRGVLTHGALRELFHSHRVGAGTTGAAELAQRFGVGKGDVEALLALHSDFVVVQTSDGDMFGFENTDDAQALAGRVEAHASL